MPLSARIAWLARQPEVRQAAAWLFGLAVLGFVASLPAILG